jgi:molybdenum cofactor cytidylyltransferase
MKEDLQIVILAAGASSRMGEHKLLMPVAGQTLLQRAVKTALKVCPNVLVVLGRDADLLKTSLEGLQVQFVINHEYQNGKMETSFQTAVAVLEPRTTLLMLADMPFINSQMLLEMQCVFVEHQPLIIASRFGDVIAPPHLFSKELLPILGQTGAKPLIKQHLEQTIFMDWAKERLFDVDTPEDFKEYETKLKTSIHNFL